jgi:hypothetical protein
MQLLQAQLGALMLLQGWKRIALAANCINKEGRRAALGLIVLLFWAL